MSNRPARSSANPAAGTPAPPEDLVVLGASPHPQRYSHRVMHLAAQKGLRVIPVNPRYQTIRTPQRQWTVAPSLSAVPLPIHTLTVYLSEQHFLPLLPQVKSAHPKRIILNPGADSPAVQRALRDAGFSPLLACTLVLLNTNQY